MNRLAQDLDRACSILGITLPPVELPAVEARPSTPSPFIDASGRRVCSNTWARFALTELKGR